jgi:ligand-binding sensor domain-containing protein
VSAPPRAQPAPGVRAQPPAFVHDGWTTREGLPVDAVTDVLQGRQGYLWLATFDGLARFDGVRFTVFNTGNSDVLPSNRLVALDETPDGSLYVRTEQRHLVRWRGGVLTRLGAAHGLADPGTRVTYVDAAGRLWVGTDDGVRVLGAGDRFVPVAAAAIRGPVEALLTDAAGTLWVGTATDGVYRVRDGVVTRLGVAEGLRPPAVTGLAAGKHGTVWVGTDAGAFRVTGDRLVAVNGADGRPLRARVLEPPGLADRRRGLGLHRGGTLRGDGWSRASGGRDAGQGVVLHGALRRVGRGWYAVDDRLYRGSPAGLRDPGTQPGRAPPGHRDQRPRW